MIHLKECPFCDNKSPHLSEAWDNPEQVDLMYYVWCSCGAEGPRGMSEQEAADRWNHAPRLSDFM